LGASLYFGDTILVFDGKSIRKGKDRIKKKNRWKARGPFRVPV